MLILSSPAKTLDFETPHLLPSPTQPLFGDTSAQLVEHLRLYDPAGLQKILGVSDTIAAMNHERFQTWQKNHTLENARPAIAAYKGDVYRQLHLDQYAKGQISYLQQSLRIISGLYGVVRPLDLIQPYRLEMRTDLSVCSTKNLHEFWRETLTSYLSKEIQAQKHNLVLNLASQEYADAIDLCTLPCPVVDVVFQDNRDGKMKIVGLLAKRARGMMIDYCARSMIADRSDLRAFDVAGYRLFEETEREMVFVRG